jgi:hypothetical protein
MKHPYLFFEKTQSSTDFIAGMPLTEEMKGNFSNIGKGIQKYNINDFSTLHLCAFI